jgi:hypothetical protein
LKLLVEPVGLLSWLDRFSVVMIGFKSWPLRRFLPPLLLALLTTCFALLIAAFLMSAPFIMDGGSAPAAQPAVAAEAGLDGESDGDPRSRLATARSEQNGDQADMWKYGEAVEDDVCLAARLAITVSAFAPTRD